MARTELYWSTSPGILVLDIPMAPQISNVSNQGGQNASQRVGEVLGLDAEGRDSQGKPQVEMGGSEGINGLPASGWTGM